LIAIHIEIKFSKKKILEYYLNTVPLRSNIEGFGLAAEFFFSKNIKFVSKEEMVALSILPKRPNSTKQLFENSFRNLWENYFQNKNYELENIFEKIENPPKNSFFTNHSALHFSDWVKNKSALIGKQKFLTTLSFPMNQKVQSILNREIEYLRKHGATQSAAIVFKLPEIDSDELELVSLVGSLDFLESLDGQVNGSSHNREAGSTLKPFVYALGIENQLLYPNTILVDEEHTVKTSWQSGNFLPRNNDLTYWGPITVSESLSNSRNIPAVKAIEIVGIPQFLQFLRKLNFSFLDENYTHYGPGLVLGSGGTNLFDLTRAYSIFLNNGKLAKVKIGTDSEDQPVYLGSVEQMISSSTAAQIRYILSRKDLRRRSFGNRNFLDFPFDVSVKTGTSKDYRDAWTIGFTDKYIVGVWVGNFAGKKMNAVSGAWGAGRSFHQIIRLFTPNNRSQFSYPNHLQVVSLCRKTGKIPNATCPVYPELVNPQKAIIEKCNSNHLEKNFISEKPRILSPQTGKKFIIDPFEPIKHQNILVEFMIPEEFSGKWEYSLDGTKKEIPTNNYKFSIPLVKGKHTIELLQEGKIWDHSIFFIQ
jgi:penicillin-binding protein 1C